MFFMNNKNPETLMEGLDKALEILNERYQKKNITIEEFTKKCEEIAEKRIKYQKIIDKQQR